MLFSMPQAPHEISPEIEPSQMIRTSQNIAISLRGGLVMFALVAISVDHKAALDSSLISNLGAGFAALEIVLQFIVPTLIVNGQITKLKNRPVASGRHPDYSKTLAGLFQQKMVIGMALLQGAAFFNLVAFMSEHQMFSLGIVGFLLLLMVMMFPTLSRFENWAEEMQRNIESHF